MGGGSGETMIRVRFRPLSPFSSEVEAYTLFGAVCWGVGVLFGERVLRELIQRFSEGDPPFLISSPLPEREGEIMLPKPVLDVYDWGDGEEDYRNSKEYKKIRYIPLSVFRRILKGELRGERKIFEELEKKGYLHHYGDRETVVHATVNRITWTVIEGLHTEEISLIGPFSVLIKFRDTSWEDKVLAALRFSQFGSNRSTGRGRCEVYRVEGFGDLEDFQEGPRFVSLSPHLYDPDIDYSRSGYEILPFAGAVDNFFGRLTRPIWKKRVLYFRSGGVFRPKRKKELYGRCGEALNYNGIRVLQYGLSFPIFMRW